jgi:hypothetical protein
MMMGACTSDDGVGEQQSKGLMPVLFSVGHVETALTRAASAAYMPEGSRFAGAMFFHAKANDDNESAFYSEDYPLLEDVNMASASLKVDNAYGNAAYQGTAFYWQNRLNHVFIGLADNNHLTSAPAVQVGEKVAFNLTHGDKTSMVQQPDPLLAVTTMSPAGATPEANRVNLFFKHQFAQIQVNLKSSQDESVDIDETLIECVELLGVAEEAYVTFAITPDGTVPATEAADYPDGSSFLMFQRTTVPTGYLKSFEAIAFGTLQGIRITWKESAAADAVRHVTTFKGVKGTKLKSGTKYIYNMELRRSLVAQVSATVKPWDMDATDYSADGTITEDNE